MVARRNPEVTPMSAMERFREYTKDVRAELGKVSWPTREELRDSTTVVIVTVLLVAAFIGLVDQGLNRAVALIFR
jgi:preprotein translocase subunit SecE